MFQRSGYRFAGYRFAGDRFAVRNMRHSTNLEEFVMQADPSKAGDKHVGARVRMRRLMLSMSQEKLADALALSFQQVQKYEKGTDRITVSRLQQISDILQVPVGFFFEAALTPRRRSRKAEAPAPDPEYISEFLATAEGIWLARAFMRIKRPALQRRIIRFVEEIADSGY